MNDGIWRKSSYSGGEINNCVELRLDPQQVSIRDSKHPAATLTVAAGAWRSLLEAARSCA